MHQAMQSAATRAFTQMLFLENHEQSVVTQFIEVNVSRDNLVEDAIREFSQYTDFDYKKPLKVRILYLKQFWTKY